MTKSETPSAAAASDASPSSCSACRRRTRSELTFQCSTCSRSYHEGCIRKHVNGSFQQGRPFTCGLEDCEAASPTDDSSSGEEPPDPEPASKKMKRGEHHEARSLFLAASAVSTHATSARHQRDRRMKPKEENLDRHAAASISPAAVTPHRQQHHQQQKTRSEKTEDKRQQHLRERGYGLSVSFSAPSPADAPDLLDECDQISSPDSRASTPPSVPAPRLPFMPTGADLQALLQP